MQLRRHAAAAGICAAAITGAGLVATPAAHADTIGNGTTSPSHDSSTAVIPLCNPISAIKWLNANFTDHGRDIANYKITLRTPLDVVEYAGADSYFHIPATLASLGGLTDFNKYCTLSYAPKTGS